MLKTKWQQGIVIAALAAGLAAGGCKADMEEEEADRALTGTWAAAESGNAEMWTFKQGTFETSIAGSPLVKGTYTTGNGKITISVDACWGAEFGLEPKWYGKAGLKEAFAGGGKAQAAREEFFDIIFFTVTAPYAVHDGALVFFHEDGETVYNKM